MAEAIEEYCVNKEQFYLKITELKQQKKTSTSPLNVFLEDSFYEKTIQHLRSKQDNPNLTKWEQNTISRKKWSYSHGLILTKDGKQVVPKAQLFDVLTEAHQRVAHRGREKTEKWLNDRNYSEINQKVITVFVGLCKIHSEQKSITDRVKPVKRPLQSEGFLSLIEMDLMDFRNCACKCSNPHTWVMSVNDHHSKFVSAYPLHGKKATEILGALKVYCNTYGYPKQILCDNGREFKNELVQTFAQENDIELKHGSPRTPTTQGLVERSNRTWKEDMRAIIMSKANKDLGQWCHFTKEASYTMNITYHRAIRATPYEAVFGFKAHREVKQHPDAEEPDLQEADQEEKSQEEFNDQRQAKRQKIISNQSAYNETMIQQTTKKQEAKKSFKVGDMVAIQIEKPDKISALHPKMLLGKIVSLGEQDYAKVVTQFGLIKGLIAPNRLNHCTATNTKFNYDKEITFTNACKSAKDQS